MTECIAAKYSVEKEALQGLLISSAMEISRHYVMLPVWPLIHKKKTMEAEN